MYKEIRIASEQRQRESDQRQRDLAMRLEELSLQVTASKMEYLHEKFGENSKKSSHDTHATSPRAHAAQDNSMFVPKYTRLDYPCYNGKSDPLAWVNSCKHFFEHQHTHNTKKVGLSSFQLEDKAQLWFRKLKCDQPEIQWDNFGEQCDLRFGPPIRDDTFGELAKLRQNQLCGLSRTFWGLAVLFGFHNSKAGSPIVY